MSDIDKIAKRFEQIQEKIKEKTTEGVGETMEAISEQSLSECPLDTGDLRESYLVNLNGEDYIKGSKSGPVKTGKAGTATGNKIEARASYSTEYAVIQHENMSFNHPTPGTKAKYLEDAVKVNRDNLVNNIAEKIKRGDY